MINEAEFLLDQAERRSSLDRLMDELKSLYREFKIRSGDLRFALDMWKPLDASSGGHGFVFMALKEIFANLQDENAKARLQHIVQEIADECVGRGDFFIAQELCSIVSIAPDLLYQHSKRHGIVLNGRGNYDLKEAIHEFGTPDEIDRTFHYFPLKEIDAFSDMGVNGKIQSSLEDLREKYESFCATADMPLCRFPVFLLDANASMELAKKEYGLSVGILSSAAVPAILLAGLDQPVAFVEWHKKWKKKNPVWKGIEGTRDAIQKGLKILLIENDAVSGATLDAVSRSLDKISPASVDVCFTGVCFSHSKKVASGMKRFDRVFHATELPQKSVYSNVLSLTESLRKKTEIQ